MYLIIFIVHHCHTLYKHDRVPWQLKEKRRQLFLKTTSEGRQRAKQKRYEIELERERRNQLDEERRMCVPMSSNLHNFSLQRTQIINNIVLAVLEVTIVQLKGSSTTMLLYWICCYELLF